MTETMLQWRALITCADVGILRFRETMYLRPGDDSVGRLAAKQDLLRVTVLAVLTASAERQAARVSSFRMAVCPPPDAFSLSRRFSTVSGLQREVISECPLQDASLDKFVWRANRRTCSRVFLLHVIGGSHGTARVLQFGVSSVAWAAIEGFCLLSVCYFGFPVSVYSSYSFPCVDIDNRLRKWEFTWTYTWD